MKHPGLSVVRAAVACIAATILEGCSGPAPSVSRSADEAAIREADAASIRAIAAKQTDTTVSYEEIRKAWEQKFAIPAFSLTPKTTKLEVAGSGDLAYAQGTYEFSATDSKGAPVHDRGKFVVVWKKQADGAWKIAADIWNSDMPLTPAPR